MSKRLLFTSYLLSLITFLLPLTPAFSAPGNVDPSNLEFWFKADTEVFENSVAGTPVTGSDASESNDPVVVWHDQSGNDYHAYQSTASEQPTYRDDASNMINFNPVLEFDGTQDYLPIQDLNYSIASNPLGDFSIFAVTQSSGTGAHIIVSYDRSSYFRFTHGDDSGGGADEKVHNDTNSGGVSDQTGNVIVNNGIPHLTGINYDQTPSEKNIYVDGGVDSNISAHASGDLGNAGEQPRYGFIGIGSEATTFDGSTGPSNRFVGTIAEIVHYKDTLTTAERNRLESYLGAKYGITLDQSGSGQDYTASDGTTVIWDTSANRSVGGFDYIYDIGAIGRDDTSVLDQRKSSSVNADSVITMEKTSAFSADMTFLSWANNNGALNTTTSGAHPSYTYRVARVWRTDVEGSPGTVTVTFDLSAMSIPNTGFTSDYVLLKDTVDADFSSGASTHTIGASFNGDLLTYTNVSFSDGEFFTLGVSGGSATPGGVSSGLEMWFKANEGVTGTTSITEWKDQSGNANDCVQSNTSNSPSLVTDDMNFNDTIQFQDSQSDFCYIEMKNFASAAVIDQLAVFSVFKTDESAGTNDNWAFLDFDRSEYFNFYVTGGGNLRGSYEATGIRDNTGSTGGLNNDEPQMGVFIYDNTISGNETILRLNGAFDLQTSREALGVGVGTGTTRYGFIGDGSEADIENGTRNNFHYDGEIAEVIYYENQSLSADDIEKIETYLAIKYGITKSGDYQDSAGNTIWDAATFSGYLNDIAGIGRDDDSALDQQKSKSENDDGVITMDKGGTFPGDLDFLVWGNDNASGTTWTTTGAPSNYQILTREWRVAVSGSPGAVSIEVDVADSDMNIPAPTVHSDYYFIYDSDNDGVLSDESPVVMSDQGGDIYGVSSITFSDGMRFTLAESTIAAGPGGITTNLQAWFRANVGVYEDALGTDTAEDGDTVLNWEDFGLTNSDATAAGASGTTPTYETDEFNFNPVIRFTDDGDEHLETGVNPVSGDMTLVAVFQTSQTDTGTAFWNAPALIGGESSGNQDDYGLGLSGGNAHMKAAQGDGFGAQGSTNYADGIPHVQTGVREQAASGNLQVFVDSNTENTTTSDNVALSDPGGIGIGNHVDEVAGGQFEGDIAEVIAFSTDLGSTDRIRVESYLAVKYGVTLVGDYRSAASTVIWDSTANATYQNDIAGLGVDVASALSQIQSKSENADAILTFSNPSALADTEFFLWGNDDDDDGTIEVISTEVVPGIDDRLDREWKVEETGEAGSLKLEVDLSGVSGLPAGLTASEIWLFVDSVDSDFSSGSSYSEVADSYSSGTATFNLILEDVLEDGYFFTIGFGDGNPYRRRVVVVESQ